MGNLSFRAATEIHGFNHVDLVSESEALLDDPLPDLDVHSDARISMKMSGGIVASSESTEVDSMHLSYSRIDTRTAERELICGKTDLSLADLKTLWEVLHENDVFALEDNSTRSRGSDVRLYQVTVEYGGRYNEFSVYSPVILAAHDDEERYFAIVRTIEYLVGSRILDPVAAGSLLRELSTSSKYCVRSP